MASASDLNQQFKLFKIEDGSVILIKSALKKMIPKMDWRYVDRSLPAGLDKFYVGTFENDETQIHISLRPGRRCKVMETQKNVMKTSQGGLRDYGTSLEIIVDDLFVAHIKSIAKPKEENKMQTFTWSD